MLHVLHAVAEVTYSFPEVLQEVFPQVRSVDKAEKKVGYQRRQILAFHRCCTVTDFRAATFNEEVITAADRVKFCFC